MREVTYKVYDFKELSDKAKGKAIEKWYETEDYPFLSDDLKESLTEKLKTARIKEVSKPELQHDLSCSQGSGLCFTGNFKWRKYDISIVHSGHYVHSNSVNIAIEDESCNSAKEEVYGAFKTIYKGICRELEKEGYAVLEYRMDSKEFEELCSANEYTFTEDGIMDNSI